MKFKIDENLPVECAEILKESGFEADTVYEEGLNGNPDSKIFSVCSQEKRILVTLDLDFSDIRTYPPNTQYHGTNADGRGKNSHEESYKGDIFMGEIKCQICDWISRFDGDEKPYFVAELETGYVVLSKWQYFRGYTFFLCKIDVSELHFLPENFKVNFLNEMSFVSEAVYNAFKPSKINCESLGNLAPHVHWHIIPRYGTDPFPERPIWGINREDLYSEEIIPSSNELEDMREILLSELRKLSINIKRDYTASN